MLRYLQVSGFKSFAHKTQLEFSSDITAIVGPNGSGKSNLADCIRWVLGEQSLKNLRIKKSEDLIFGGSPNKPRSSRSRVSLFLDNSDNRFHIDYNEVALERQAFRDGENQYLINNSRVRLMDLEEFLAKSRFGSKGYSVVHQDMADALLRATIQERRAILEDAIGVREYQLKKQRTENKLALAENNLAKVADLTKEIAPHLKYLKKQVDQIEKRKKIENKSRVLQGKLFSLKFLKIKNQQARIFDESKKAATEKLSLEKDLAALKKELTRLEELTRESRETYDAISKELENLQGKINNFERELAKIEGRIEIESEKKEQARVLPADMFYIKENLEKIYSALKKAASMRKLSEIKKEIENLTKKIEDIFYEIKHGRVLKQEKSPSNSTNLEELKKVRGKIKEDLKQIEDKLNNLRSGASNIDSSHRKDSDRLFEIERKIQINQIKLNQFQAQEADLIQKRNFLKLEIVKLESEAVEAGADIKNLADKFSEPGEENQEMELEIKLEKLKRKLISIGGINPEIIREFEETDKRYEFLTGQYNDLQKAVSSLKDVIIELKEKIEAQFKEGFENINREFNKYFRIIFGGGRARLKTIRLASRKIGEETTDENVRSSISLSETDSQAGLDNQSEDIAGDLNLKEEGPVKIGVEVQVELPGKKINNLNVLSGGERALTSVALLFAIIISNPPPFVVLDEIDAALDEANSRRFGSLLKELSKKTQFVVITHNRETMRQASVLYGVTMEEGVSKLLSLKLD